MEALAIKISSIQAFLYTNPTLLMLIVIWIAIWKGIALWKAARLSHRWWFIILLVVNTLGILEIIYIYFISRKYTVVEDSTSETEN
jgi:hypothetical protein